MANYSQQQKALAVRIQVAYRNDVANAWKDEALASQRRVEAVRDAEHRRNEALRENGIALNDLSDLLVGFRAE